MEKLLTQIKAIREAIDEKQAKKYNLPQLERVVKRLGQFSPECEECNNQLSQLEIHVERIKNLDDKVGAVHKEYYKEYMKAVQKAIGHLQKEHKLVSEGYYTSTYMSIGLALGLPLGLTFGNMVMGMPIGLAIGLAIGAGMDADAKKKGLVI